MMKIALAFCISLTALTALTARADDANLIEAAKQVVARDFKDPESAQFRNLEIKAGKRSTVVCGEVNAKNSYGGYVGFRKFYVVDGSSRAVIKSGDQIIDPLVDTVCKLAS